MNEEETNIMKVEENPDRTEPASGGRLQGVEGSGRSSTGCNLYRWYPPLLVLSTVMSAAFCVLYVTKPVFLEAPDQSFPDQLNVPVFAEQIAKTEMPVPGEPGKSLMPVHLDPDFLPSSREENTGPEETAGLPPAAELKPLGVARSAKPLFEPMAPEELAAMDSSRAITVEEPASGEDAPQRTVPETDPGRAVAVAEPVDEAPREEDDGYAVEEAVAMASAEELEAVQEDLQGDADESVDDSDGEPLVADADAESGEVVTEPAGVVMRASVLGEFYSAGGIDQTHGGGPTGSSTAMALRKEP